MKDLKEFVGQDKIVGRPLRLNRVELKVNKKGYAPLLFFGDLHLGHPQCAIKEAKEMLDWALKERVQTLLMGDMIEAGLRESVGESVYFQKLNPQEQIDAVVDLLIPLAEAGLIIGFHTGNHEWRITKQTSIDVGRLMANQLKVSYCGYAGWHLLRVGSQNYTLYATHGAGGSRFKHTKLKTVVDLAGWISADVIAHGHLHGLAAEPIIKQYIDLRDKTIKEGKCYAVLTGSYLGWQGSYAQNHNFPVPKIGSPKAKFLADKKDVHFSL